MHDYHDATLKVSTIDWEGGRVRLTFDLCGSPTHRVSITVRDFSEFMVERHFPWGKSVFVNRLSTDEIESSYRLQIEMQSGDNISIIGKDIQEIDD